MGAALQRRGDGRGGDGRGLVGVGARARGGTGALRASHMVIILVGAFWTRSRPAPAQLAAFRADASLAFMHPAFAEAFEAAIATWLRGLIAESADATTRAQGAAGSA